MFLSGGREGARRARTILEAGKLGDWCSESSKCHLIEVSSSKEGDESIGADIGEEPIQMRVVTAHAVCAPFVALGSFTVFFKSSSKFLHPNVFICLKIRHVADTEYFAPSVF